MNGIPKTKTNQKRRQLHLPSSSNEGLKRVSRCGKDTLSFNLSGDTGKTLIPSAAPAIRAAPNEEGSIKEVRTKTKLFVIIFNNVKRV